MLPTLLTAACAGGGSKSATPTATSTSPPADVPTPLIIEQPTPDPDKPNIVVFMADDMTVEQMQALPKIQQRIFERGVTFTQSVVNLPSCCPSRATFLTGQHAANHGVLTNHGVSGGFSSFERQEETLPVALAETGYRTVFVGKYLNEFGLREELRYTPPGWGDFRALIAPTEVLYHSPSLWVNGRIETYTEDDPTSQVIHTAALEAIADAATSDRPLFAFVSYPAPHAQAGAPLTQAGIYDAQRDADELSDDTFLRPPLAAPGDEGTFATAALPTHDGFNETDISDKPAVLARRARSKQELEAVTTFHQAALDSLVSVDRSAAELMDLIEELSPTRETWYLFTSDNGLLVGEHRQFGVKYLPYEETVRVPLGISGPGVTPGGTSALVSNVDLTPTIVDIAGAKPPRPPDGRSLLPLLVGEEAPSGRAVLIQGFDFRPSSPPYRAVHTGDSVYVEWLTGDRELYDLVADPHQLNNLAGQSTSEALELRNESLLRRLESCAGTECAQVGSELPVPANPSR